MRASNYLALLLFLVVYSLPLAVYSSNGTTLGLPSGSYLGNCRSCQLSGNQLLCLCSTDGKSWKSTSLSDFQSCNWVNFINGGLKCQSSRVQPRIPMGYPTGSYLQSCKACSYNGSVLSCTCQRNDGSWGNASVSVVGGCSSVNNMGGRLVCMGR